MHSNIYNYFLANKLDEFKAGDEDFKLMSDFKKIIDDQLHYQFIIDSQNGGFFFENSLHVYGFTANPSFHDIRIRL